METTIATAEAKVKMERMSSSLLRKKRHATVAERLDTWHQIVLMERRCQEMSGTCAKQ